MTNIDFYILPHQSQEQRLIFACRLIEKARSLGKSIVVAVDSDEEAEALDRLLWTFKPESFLPHQIYSLKPGANAPGTHPESETPPKSPQTTLETPAVLDTQTDLDTGLTLETTGLIINAEDSCPKCPDEHGVLINLKSLVPGYFSQFGRLAEIVCQDPAVLASTRNSFRFYRDRGYPIQSHNLQKNG